MSEKIRWIRLIIYAAIFILIYMIPLETVEGQRLCIWYHLFHMDCLGCGFTRAFFCLMHGQILKAFTYNPMVIVVPVAFFLVLQDSWMIIQRSPQWSLLEKFFKWGMARCYPHNIKNG